MKYEFYGFVSDAALIDNSRHAVSVVGELSADARTFALDKTYHTDPNYPGVTVIGFKSLYDGTREDQPDTNVSAFCIALGGWITKQAKAGRLGTQLNDIMQNIKAEFPDDIESIRLGKLINGSVTIPQWVEVKFKLSKYTQYDDKSLLKLWFSDKDFKAQYPFYNIVVIPPIDNLDDFYGSLESVKEKVANISLKAIHDKANRLKESSPYTFIKTFNFKCIKGQGEVNEVDVPWTILIYGGIGENLNLITNEIGNWILENSSQDRRQWEQVFPDIFIPTEFTFMPFWTLSSVPSYRLIQDIYGPTIPYGQILDFVKSIAPFYPEDHLRNHVEIMPSLFKSLGCAVVGHPNNRAAPKSFYAHYPQYALIHSRSDDFNRMDARTQDFIEMLNTLYIEAESATDDYISDLSITKIKRDGVLYVGKVLDNIQFLVACKSNYENDKYVKITKPTQ